MSASKHPRLRLLAACILATTSTPAVRANSIAPPPASDGSSGSFDAIFTNAPNGEEWIVTDTGAVLGYVGGGWTTIFTIPTKIIKYNGQTVHAFEFTDFNMEQPVVLRIFGSTPAVFLAQGDVTIRGQILFENANPGGVSSSGNNNNFNGGAGSGKTGGKGGVGPGLAIQTTCAAQTYTGSGGGGGGNYSPGSAGFHGFVPSGPGMPNNVPNPYQGGNGGKILDATTLQSGGGGGAPGAGEYEGAFFPGPAGGQAGGSVVFGTPGSITVASTGLLNAAGKPGGQAVGNSGSSGGGAGGEVWFFSAGSMTNAGQILANGGAGGTTVNNHKPCEAGQHTVAGPDGGDGSGGIVRIAAPAITNSGTISVAGGGTSTNGGLVSTGAIAISNTGTFWGVRSFQCSTLKRAVPDILSDVRPSHPQW